LEQFEDTKKQYARFNSKEEEAAIKNLVQLLEGVVGMEMK
jgi:hypothetical protein